MSVCLRNSVWIISLRCSKAPNLHHTTVQQWVLKAGSAQSTISRPRCSPLLAEAYPLLILVSLGQHQDLNAPSSLGTASCSTSTFCNSWGDFLQGSAASQDRDTAAFLVFTAGMHFEVWASSVEKCPGGTTGTGSARLNIWRGNATQSHEAERLYHVVRHFEDGQLWRQLVSFRISSHGLASSLWI